MISQIINFTFIFYLSIKIKLFLSQKIPLFIFSFSEIPTSTFLCFKSPLYSIIISQNINFSNNSPIKYPIWTHSTPTN